MESDHGLEKILGVGLELEFKSMDPDSNPKKSDSTHLWWLLAVMRFSQFAPGIPKKVGFRILVV